MEELRYCARVQPARPPRGGRSAATSPWGSGPAGTVWSLLVPLPLFGDPDKYRGSTFCLSAGVPMDVGAALLTWHIPNRIAFPGSTQHGMVGELLCDCKEKPGIDFMVKISGVGAWGWLTRDHVFGEGPACFMSGRRSRLAFPAAA